MKLGHADDISKKVCYVELLRVRDVDPLSPTRTKRTVPMRLEDRSFIVQFANSHLFPRDDASVWESKRPLLEKTPLMASLSARMIEVDDRTSQK